MPDKFPFQKILLCAAASLVALAGCAVNLPPAPASNPADARAPESATAPLRPQLLATSRTFLSSHADDREQEAKQMEHEMKGMKSLPKEESAETYFTCPMHHEIREAKPGQCPICGMTLVKKSGAAEGAKP